MELQPLKTDIKPYYHTMKNGTAVTEACNSRWLLLIRSVGIGVEIRQLVQYIEQRSVGYVRPNNAEHTVFREGHGADSGSQLATTVE